MSARNPHINASDPQGPLAADGLTSAPPSALEGQMPIRYSRQAYLQFGTSAPLRDQILAGTGLTPEDLEDPDKMITNIAAMQQIQNLHRLFGYDFPIKARKVWRPASQGALDIAFRASPTIKDGLELIARYTWVRVPQIHTEYKTQTIGSTFIITPTHNLPLEIWRTIAEITSLALHAMIENIADDDSAWSQLSQDVQYHWSWPAPAYHQDMEREIGGHHIYDARSCQVFIPASLTTLRSPFADRHLLKAALSDLEAAHKRLESSASLSKKIATFFVDNPVTDHHANEAARFLGMAPRTMVRRLADEGTSFRQLRDDHLKASAKALILDSTLGRDAIAEALGYADPSSFNRACRKWFGCSMRALRAKNTSQN